MTKGASKLTGAGFFSDYAHYRYTSINGPMFEADRVFENYHGVSSLLKRNKEA